ncbi:MAG: hypothetical protein V1862_08095 [Methanobacteriota archaeon]
MKYSIIVLIFLTGMIFLIPGVSAENLLTLESSFVECWNNGNMKLPGPGLLMVPKGPGIITTTLTQEPFWRAGTIDGEQRILFRNTGSPDANTSPGLLLGETYYQKGAIIGTRQGVSDGLSLTTVSRYYSNNETPKIWNIQVVPVIVVNTHLQLADKVRFTVSWEPLKQSRVTDVGCDVSGTWKTNWGDISLTDTSVSYDRITLTGNYTRQSRGTFDGTLTGPIFTGVWSEPGSVLGDEKGRFTFLFRDDCCSFTGTWGTGESDTNGGEWSGMRT